MTPLVRENGVCWLLIQYIVIYSANLDGSLVRLLLLLWLFIWCCFPFIVANILQMGMLMALYVYRKTVKLKNARNPIIQHWAIYSKFLLLDLEMYFCFNKAEKNLPVGGYKDLENLWILILSPFGSTAWKLILYGELQGASLFCVSFGKREQ